MMNRRETRESGGSKHVPLVAVAIDKDKGSQNALKWALDNVVTSKGESITLVHINTNKASSSPSEEGTSIKEIFAPFRIFCKRKDVNCHDIVIDDTDIAKALIDFISQEAIEKMILGAPSKSFMRFKSADVPTNVLRSAPDFCNVYVISKSKVSSVRKAAREAPSVSPLRTQIENQNSVTQEKVEYQVVNALRGEHARENRNNLLEKEIVMKSPFTRPGAPRFPARSNNGSNSKTESDISFVSSGRPSIDGGAQRLSYASVDSFDMPFSPLSSNTIGMFSNSSGTSISQTMMGEDSETEMSRLRLELKQMMDMYNTACKEALDAKKQMNEYRQWKSEEENRLLEAKRAQESALEMIEKERAKWRAAIEAAEKAKEIAEIEAQKRIRAERKAMEEAEERWRAMANFKHVEVRYRMYTIEEIQTATENFSPSKKVGEGGYGPVYKCYLDHTPVAVKVLKSDASQGRSQFQQEVEILSCIRHPNMVLLLGACPENGCLVYEYMANGSLEDRLFMKENTPPIPWQHRFRIAAEIGTGLLFLHQSKPEPLVHRDLKPANILLDRNYVSKISDVGLARLVPPSVANTVTQYHLTSTAGTFCYIDPEYQQTGMLGTKSDIYSFGIILLQLLTGRPAIGITRHIENALEQGTLSELLDPTVPYWPVEDAELLARLALKCTELRRKDRPDLATVILPELNRMRDIGEANMHYCPMGPIMGTPSFMSNLTYVPDYTASESESSESK